MNKLTRILTIFCIVLLSGVLINAKFNPTNEEVSDKLTEEKSDDTYKIRALKIPDGVNFAGELVPIDIPDIRERMDRELLVNTYWQSNSLLMMKRAHKYFPIIEPILKKNGIPDDFKYLALIESGFLQVTSHAGARGFWQIMKGTAKENGLEVNSNVDERYHIEMSTEVACIYLKKAYERFDSWTLAAAAYNGGNYGMARRLKSQRVDNYYDLLLGQETGRYVFRIVAVKEILKNPQNFGFKYDQEDLYQLEKTKLVKVDTAITDIALFAKNFGTNYKELKIHNPWLRENHLNNKSRKLYHIKLPE
ncbi:MAG: murein transglycosylase [Bacteroidetes bacterium MedPE-SWsnd-G1]|nr:MAG: murein transglycosylase [Bacteroidetes bacterium MedPE-SWsnd-G1]